MSYRPKYFCNCPFNESQTEKRIQCEGVNGPESIKMIFESEEEKNNYIKKYCSNHNPEGCEVYNLIMKKYV